MSLKEAVLEFADEMEEAVEAVKVAETPLYSTVLSYIRQLRRLCKATQSDPVAKDSFAFDPEKGMFLQTEAAQAMKELKTNIKQEERLGAAMIWCRGGPNDDTMVEMDAQMVEGSTPIFCGAVYKRVGNELVFQPELTEKFQRQQLQVSRDVK